MLEGRSWGEPPDGLIDRWYIRAAQERDPSVQVPYRIAAVDARSGRRTDLTMW